MMTKTLFFVAIWWLICEACYASEALKTGSAPKVTPFDEEPSEESVKRDKIVEVKKMKGILLEKFLAFSGEPAYLESGRILADDVEIIRQAFKMLEEEDTISIDELDSFADALWEGLIDLTKSEPVDDDESSDDDDDDDGWVAKVEEARELILWKFAEYTEVDPLYSFSSRDYDEDVAFINRMFDELRLTRFLRLQAKIDGLVEYTWKIVILHGEELVKAQEAHDDAKRAKERSRMCSEMGTNLRRRGFILPDEKKIACDLACDWVASACDGKNDDGTMSAEDLRAYVAYPFVALKELFEGVATGDPEALNTLDILGRGLEFTDAQMELWWFVMSRIWPVFLSFVFVLMNQYQYTNFWFSIMVTLGTVLLGVFGYMTRAVAVHNTVVCLVCMMASANSNALLDMVWGIIGIFAVFIGVFSEGELVQAAALIGVIIMYAVYVFNAFFMKGKASGATLLIMICQALIVIEQIYYVRTKFILQSVSGIGVEMALNAIIPCGESRAFITNVGVLSYQLMVRLRWVRPAYHVIVFGASFLLQVFAFIFFRCAIGAHYIHELRYAVDVRTLAWGFYVYSCDLFGPLSYLLRWGVRLEHYNFKRVSYSAVGLSLAFFEFRYAHEFALFRLMMTLTDIFFWKSRYGQMTHYLSMNVNMSSVAFPQKNSKSWMSMNQLWDVSGNVVKLYVDKGKAGAMQTFKGIGYLCGKKTKTTLYTVLHVIDGCASVEIRRDGERKNLITPDFHSVGSAADPVVAVKTDLACDKSLDVLTRGELDNVDYLCCITLDDDDEPMMNMIDQFSFDESVIKASVNLKKGDSGSPIFAVLSNGTIRLAGVVSKGNFDQGGGNILSLIVPCETARDSSSSDGSECGDPVVFNQARQRVRFKFADDIDKSQARIELNDFIRANKDVLNKVKDLDYFPAPREFKRAEVFSDFVSRNSLYDGEESHPRQGGGDDYDDGHDGRRKNRVKSSFKDRAAKKRGFHGTFDVLKDLLSKLRIAYPLETAEAIYVCVCTKGAPVLKNDETIRINSGVMVIDDTPWIGGT